MKRPSLSHPKSRLQFEPGGWITLRQSVPELHSLSSEELLHRMQAILRVPLRYGRTAHEVVLIGECPLLPEDEDSTAAQSRILDWLTSDSATEVPDRELVETVLDQSVPGWTQQEDGWSLPANGEVGGEILVRAVPGGLQLESTLVTCERADDPSRAAMAEFVCRAQVALRFARAELAGPTVRVVSLVETEAFGQLFEHARSAVVSGCRTIGQEVRALSSADLAEMYLEYVQTTGRDAPAKPTNERSARCF